MPLRAAPVPVFAPAGEGDLGDRHRIGVDATGGERGVRRGHVERRDPDRAEAERRHVRAFPGLERRAHPQPVRHRRDLVRAEIERQAGVDGVVREQRRLRDRRRADVRVRVGRDVPGLLVRVRLIVERRRHIRRRVGIDALGDRLGEDEGLERRAGLATCLCGEIELVARASRRNRRHRLDRTRARVDRDERRGGVGVVVERVLDRLRRSALHPRVDRRVDLEPTGADRRGAVPLDQLVAHVAEEVGLADPAVEPPGRRCEVRGLDALLVVAVADVAVLVQRLSARRCAARARARGFLNGS